eukprot:TRINITY_DN32965_c0_g1_i1.p1 TRINITY_DN32965_c0_g1~~TRINITY_DN32965_c0_g1_i1.p1  ORF type:complete len:239 (+),score=43.43 TRINITY_DN32965_c0_g1_i1:114-830(+)
MCIRDSLQHCGAPHAMLWARDLASQSELRIPSLPLDRIQAEIDATVSAAHPRFPRAAGPGGTAMDDSQLDRGAAEGQESVEVLFSFKTYMHSPEVDAMGFEVMQRFDPDLLVVSLILWGYRGSEFNGNLSPDQEMRYFLDLLSDKMPRTSILHMVERSKEWPDHKERAERLIRMLDSRDGRGQLVLDKERVLESLPKDAPAGHGYSGPATDLWARVVIATLCGQIEPGKTERFMAHDS